MNYYFLSDIHGNLPALEIVLKNIEKDSTIIFLGDIVNYGPWSSECVELIDTIENKVLIIGNHEKYYLKPELITNTLVKKFYDVTITNFKPFNLISNYLERYNIFSYQCIHTINNEKIFKDTKVNIRNNFIIGHTHKQYINVVNKFKIINPGSVGQNRDNLNIISYCKLNNKNFFEFFNIEYNANIILKKMKYLKYPQECIEYYYSKL